MTSGLCGGSSQVVSDGYVMDGDALRKEAGFSGRPK
jgi:hypothetical protein